MSKTVSLFDGTKPIDQVLASNLAWANNIGTQYPALFPALGAAQQPQILWLGCSDSRVPETTLLGLNPGDVFTHRNIANLVSPTDTSFPAVLNYAVNEMKIPGTETPCVKHIIICGHIGCGGVKASIAATIADTPTPVGIAEIDNWLAPLEQLIRDHRGLLTAIGPGPAQQRELVTLNVQRGLARIRALPTIIKASLATGLLVHGAIYDVTNGHLSFLSANNEAEPLIEPPKYSIGSGQFSTTQVRSIPQEQTLNSVVFSTPYSKPPRIVVGLSAVDVVVNVGNPRMTVMADNITATGFQLHLNTWGGSQLVSAACSWLEIPDDDDHRLFQNGVFDLLDDHPWYESKEHTARNITFPNTYTTPPSVVVWLSRFDFPQSPDATINVYASNVSTTGFTINIDTAVGKLLYGGAANWLAYPQETSLIAATGPFGYDGSLTPGNSVMTTFFNTPKNMSAVVSAITKVHFTAGSDLRIHVVQLGFNTQALYTDIASWGDSLADTCVASYVGLP